VAGVVYFCQNPSNPAQSYTLWDTGRIDPSPGTLPIFDGPEWFGSPLLPARALYVSDWAGPSGFVLDTWGGVHAFGAESPPGSGQLGYIMPGVPYTGGISGVQTLGPAKYVDWEWDDQNNGQGYICDYWGQIYHFGGALACPRSGPRYASPVVRRFQMQFTGPKRSMMMDYGGARNQDWPSKQLALDGYYDASRDWARWLLITDWGSASPVVDPSGYMLLASGVVVEWGPNKPQDAFGLFVGNQGTQAALGLINPANPLDLASGPADPLTLVQVAVGGQRTQYTASTAPTVLAGGMSGTPALVVTDTTRPWLMWSYSDPQSDSQRAYQVLVFTQAVVTARGVGANPLFWSSLAVVNVEGTDSTRRGVLTPVDLQNGAYRMYVRAQDTSKRWSAWSNRGWTQTVPTPDAPTGLGATVDEFHVNLVLTAAVVEVGQLAVFEASDDAGLTWLTVRGAEAVPLALTTYAVDWDIPLGMPRTYRARLFYNVPRTISNPSPERTVTVERYEYVITSCDDPTLGGAFPVSDLSWSRPRSVGVFEPLGAEFPILINDGAVRARRGEISVDTWDPAEYRRLVAVLSPASTLLVRDQFGEAVFCRVSGDWEERLKRAAPSLDESTGIGHAHAHGLPLVEVARPVPVPPETD